ncbi:MAG: hypothetical protein ACE5HA_03295 [Anaerolineae bacterium]
MPQVAAAIAITATLASGTVSAIEQRRGAKEAKREGRRRAAEISAEAKVEEERERERAARLLASQRAGFGAAGVTQAGTPALVQVQSLFDSLRERERILSGAARQSEAVRRQSRNKARALNIGAGTTLLTSVGKAGAVGIQGGLFD